ncbi:MAG: hypothetical protein GY765_38415 [bacterium]|nr:hypothetical protein [bacterium]
MHWDWDLACVDYADESSELGLALLTAAVFYFLYIATRHYSRVLAFKYTSKLFFSNCAALSSGADFETFIHDKFGPGENPEHFYIEQIYYDLLDIFLHYRENGDRRILRASIGRLKNESREFFVAGNRRSLIILIGALGSAILGLIGAPSYAVVPHSYELGLWGQGFLIFVFFVYFSRQKYATRVENEIDGMEKIYSKYLL